MARDAYQQGGISGLSIALEATSPEDFTNRMVMMDTVYVGPRCDAARTGHDAGRGKGRPGSPGRRAPAGCGAEDPGPGCACPGHGRQTDRCGRQGQARPAVCHPGPVRRNRGRQEGHRDHEHQVNAGTVEHAGSGTCGASTRCTGPSCSGEGSSRGRGSGSPPASSPQYAPAKQPRVPELPIQCPGVLGVRPAVPPDPAHWRLHAGIDFGTRVGRRSTPPRLASSSAPAGRAATATASSSTTAPRGVDLTTTYNHLTPLWRRRSRRRGQLIAYSGTTGLLDWLPPALRDRVRMAVRSTRACGSDPANPKRCGTRPPPAGSVGPEVAPSPHHRRTARTSIQARDAHVT